MDRDSRLVQVFARTPVIGSVKTRLIPLLGAQGAFELHLNLTSRLLDSLDSIDADVEIWTDLDPKNQFLSVRGKPLVRQSGKNLGEKMAYAISRGLLSFEKVVLVGVDVPELDDIYVTEAFNHLDSHSIVVGPVIDGGFGLIAAREFHESIFEGVEWGGPHVLRQVVKNMNKARLSHFMTKTLWDVDLPDDYARYQEWLDQT